MAEATFEKLARSDMTLYGPRRLVLCGFPAAAQAKFNTVLEMAGLADVPLVWAGAEHAALKLSELLALPAGAGQGTDSNLPRAVIVAGIRQNAFHALMAVCRQSGMQQALWAVLTPTSETWTLGALLAELAAERSALQKQKRV